MRTGSPAQKRKRGSAIVYVVMMVTGTSAITATTLDLSGAALRRQLRSERAIQWDLTQHSVKAYASAALKNRILLPILSSVEIGGGNVKFDLAESPTRPGIEVICAMQTTVGRESYSAEVTLGSRTAPDPFYFAAFVDKIKSDQDSYMIGSTYCRAKPDMSGKLLTVRENFYTRAETPGPEVSSEEKSYYNTKEFTRPGLNSAYYLTASTRKFLTASTISSPTFSASSTYRDLYHVLGQAAINGQFQNDGVIYATNDITITEPIRGRDPGNRLVIITPKDVYLPAGEINVFIYSLGSVRPAPGNTGVTTVIGAICANEIRFVGARLDIKFDNHFWLNPKERAYFHLPAITELL